MVYRGTDGNIYELWWDSANGWGIGNLTAKCPRCGELLPMIRRPTSLGEFLWGGWTCGKCGAAVDKYGQERKA